ncbi:MAG: glycosyltransferase [Candidatus Cloacimonetes bacterium]|nr:glycosyltransferase [Candidatus Cloacimonadota bacterium]
MNILISNLFSDKLSNQWHQNVYAELEHRGHNFLLLTDKRSNLYKNSLHRNNLMGLKNIFLFNPILLIKIYNILKKNSIDVVINFSKNDLYLTGISAFFKRIPNIFNYICYNSLETINNTDKILISTLTNHFIFNSKFSYHNINSLIKIQKNKVSIIYNAFDCNKLDNDKINLIRRSWGFQEDNTIIGIKCKLTKENSVQDLIEVFKQLLKNHKNIRLIITGKGKYKQKLIDLVYTYSINDYVYFAHSSKKTLLNIYAYDICVFTSKTEILSNVIFEYLTTKKPIICTKTQCNQEILQDTYNSLLYNSDNVSDLYNKISHILINKSTADYIANNAFKTSQQYNFENMAANIEKMLTQIKL